MTPGERPAPDSACTGAPIATPYTLTGNVTFYARWVLRGDVNQDGTVDILDARMILRADAALITLTPLQTRVADVNDDNSADPTDARKILRYDAGLITSLD
jgi:hypothetical protein